MSNMCCVMRIKEPSTLIVREGVRPGFSLAGMAAFSKPFQCATCIKMDALQM